MALRKQSHLWFFVTLLVLSLGMLGTQAARQGGANVPPPPAERADRFGIYSWGIDCSSYPVSPAGDFPDRLNWGANYVAEIGSRSIHVALPGDIYAVGQMSDDLVAAAQSPAYDKLFSDPRFKTYFMTAYSSTEVVDSWGDGYSQAEYDATREDYRRLGEYFLSTPKFAGKTFVILSWEADNALAAYANKQTVWDSYTAWVQSRTDGIKLARQRYPDSAARLFAGMEFNLVRSRKTGLRCGTPVADPLREDPLQNRCAIDYVAPRVDVDYYMYSAWLTLDVKFSGVDASFKQALKEDLDFALAQVRTRRPDVTEANFIIAEYGAHRTRWGENLVADYTNEMFDALEGPGAFNVSYAFFWQIIDNVPPATVEEDGFGLYRSRHGLFGLTRAGLTFQQRLRGQTVPKWTGGPFLRRDPPGVVDAQTETAEIRTDSVINLYAKGPETPFSANGNRIGIEQGFRQFLLPRDNAALFSETPQKLTASLPPSLRPGWATVYVFDKDNLESQAQFIQFKCEACPQLDEARDERLLREFYPGALVTLSGRKFSPTDNSVIIEVQGEQRQLDRYVIAAADLLQQSSTQLQFRLPTGMMISRFVLVTVADSSGRESNQLALPGVYKECVSCPPALSPFHEIVARNSGAPNLPAGVVATITGGRFSPSGNTVIVEQAGQRFTLVHDADWQESTTMISAKLPAALKPGYALLYVINADGRESKGKSFTVARSTPATRPVGPRSGGRRLDGTNSR